MAPKATAPKVTAGEYRHYKGNHYRVLDIADYTGENTGHGRNDPRGFPEGELLVVYIGLYDNPHGNRVCTRPVSEWSQNLIAARLTLAELKHALSTIPSGKDGDDVRRRYHRLTYLKHNNKAEYSGIRYERVGD